MAQTFLILCENRKCVCLYMQHIKSRDISLATSGHLVKTFWLVLATLKTCLRVKTWFYGWGLELGLG